MAVARGRPVVEVEFDGGVLVVVFKLPGPAGSCTVDITAGLYGTVSYGFSEIELLLLTVLPGTQVPLPQTTSATRDQSPEMS